MIESDLWKYKESIYRQTIIDRDNEIHQLKQEIETLKNKEKVYTGYPFKCSETTLEIALPRYRKYTGTHD